MIRRSRVILVACSVLFLSFVLIYNHGKTSKNTIGEAPGSQGGTQRSNPNESAPHPCSPWSTTGLVMAYAGGRLGNQMGEYATAVSLAKIKGAKPVITTEMKDFLGLFPNLSVHLYQSELSQECLSSFFNVSTWGWNVDRKVYESDYIFLDTYPMEPAWFHIMKYQLRRREFSFHESMTEDVRGFLGSIASDLRKESLDGAENIIYIGIHVRRTDYLEHLQQFEADIFGPIFYTKAAKLMRKLIAKKRPWLEWGKQHLAFVVATDDADWCRRELQDLPQVLSSARQKESYSIHFTADYHGLVQQDPAHFDLAVLSHCNHSIFDYGTFGFWGAYLAGGITVLPDLSHVYPLHGKIRNASLTDWHMLKLT